jgi:hypothetical protein
MLLMTESLIPPPAGRIGGFEAVTSTPITGSPSITTIGMNHDKKTRNGPIPKETP